MPRIRTIKPEFWTDEKIVELSPLARLLFIGSWNYADDFGCLSASAKQLKLRVIPTAIEDAEKLVEELFDAGLLERLETSDGREFWHVANWGKHQRVNRPSESEYGDPTGWRKPSTRGFSEDAVRTHEPLTEDSRGKGKERKGKEVALRADAARNPIWDTLVELFGEPSPARRSLYGKQTKWLAEQEATPDEMRTVAREIVTEWGTKALTVNSIVDHWNRYRSEVGMTSDADIERYQHEQERTRRLAELQTIDRALEA